MYGFTYNLLFPPSSISFTHSRMTVRRTQFFCFYLSWIYKLNVIWYTKRNLHILIRNVYVCIYSGNTSLYVYTPQINYIILWCFVLLFKLESKGCYYFYFMRYFFFCCWWIYTRHYCTGIPRKGYYSRTGPLLENWLT